MQSTHDTFVAGPAAPESPRNAPGAERSSLGEARGVVLAPLSPSVGFSNLDECESSPLDKALLRRKVALQGGAPMDSVSSPVDSDLLKRKAMRSKKAPVVELFGPSYDVRPCTINEDDVPRGASPPLPHENVTSALRIDVSTSSPPPLSPGPLSWDVVGSLSMPPSRCASDRSVYNREQFSPSMGEESDVWERRFSLCASPAPLQPYLSTSDAPDHSARAAYNSAAYSPSMGAESDVETERASLSDRVLSKHALSPGGVRPFGEEERAAGTERDFPARADYNSKVFSPSMGVTEEERAELSGRSFVERAAHFLAPGASRSPSRSPSHSPGDSMSPEEPFHHALGGRGGTREVSPSDSTMSACTTASDATSLAPGDGELFYPPPPVYAKSKSLVARVFSSLFGAVMG
ncbi:hypothetical protein T484DRAFT_1951623 [Baffinella frigidus]|nr:hypothetical protein T484DRAFT_1951623 [Cryptophyta sp. CCMP2293]